MTPYFLDHNGWLPLEAENGKITLCAENDHIQINGYAANKAVKLPELDYGRIETERPKYWESR